MREQRIPDSEWDQKKFYISTVIEFREAVDVEKQREKGRKMNIRRLVTTNIILFFLLTSCEGQITPTPTPQPPTPTPPPTPAPSPTPIDYTITAENAHLVEELHRFGKGEINSLTVSPNGEDLVVISSIGVWIYSLETGELVRYIEGHPQGGFIRNGSFNYPTWSPDGQLLVVPLQLGGVWIFDTEKWNVVAEKGLASEDLELVTCVDWSSDSQRLATDGEDGSVWVWSREDNTWELFPSISGTDTCVSWTDEDQLIVLADISEGEQRGIFDAKTGNLLKKLSLLPGMGDLWSPNGEYIFTRRLLSFELFNIKSNQIFYGDELYSSFAWSPDGRNFAAGPFRVSFINNQAPLLIDLSKEIVTKLSPVEDDIIALCWTWDGTLLILSQKDIGLTLWKYTTGKELVNLAEHLAPSRGILQASPSSTVITNGSAIEEWDLENHQLAKSYEHENQVFNAVISHDQDLIITIEWSGEINVWDVSGYLVHIIEGFPFSDLYLSPDGIFLAYLDSELSVCIWDLRWGKVIEKLEVRNFPEKMAWSQTSDRLFVQYGNDLWVVTVNLDDINLDLRSIKEEEFFWGAEGNLLSAEIRNNYLSISNADTGEHLLTSDPGELIVSPDGMKLVVPIASETSSSFLIYELEFGNLIGMVRTYSGERVSWSPDGSLIAIYTQEHDGAYQIILVDAILAEKISEILIEFPVNELIWTDDGTKLFFSDEAGIIHIWGLPWQLE